MRLFEFVLPESNTAPVAAAATAVASMGESDASATTPDVCCAAETDINTKPNAVNKQKASGHKWQPK